MRTINKLLTILFLTVIAITNLQAQNQIDIKLKQPPSNQLGVGDMWNLELNNTSGKDMKIYLTGTATEEKDGLIINGISKIFTVKPGKTNYKYNDFSGAEIKYNNSKYKEIILRTGNAPEGTYTICVTAFNESGTEVGRENCIVQPVKQMGSITLLTPGDGEEIPPGTPVNFSWTPLQKTDGYTLKIVEIRGEQSPEVAMKENRAFFEKKRMNRPLFQKPNPEKNFEEGKKYAWQIRSGNVSSEVRVFKMRSTLHLEVNFDTLFCTAQSGVYSFRISAFNRSNNSFIANLLAPTVVSSPPGTVTVTSAIVNPMAIGSSQIVTGTILFGAGVVVSTVELQVIFQKITPLTNYPIDAVPTTVMNNCCVPPPANMVGWWTFDETSGTTFFDRAGFNSVGTWVPSTTSPLFTPGRVAGALNFNNGYVSVPNHIDLNITACDRFSIDAWIRTIAGGTRAIVDKREMTRCGHTMGYVFYIQNGRLGFQLSNGVSTFAYLAPVTLTNPTLNNGNWQHVAVTFEQANASSTVIILYRNGVAIHTATITTVLGNPNNNAPLLIGGSGTLFNGDIDEVEIFKRVLAPGEIMNIFSAGSAGKCKN